MPRTTNMAILWCQGLSPARSPSVACTCMCTHQRRRGHEPKKRRKKENIVKQITFSLSPSLPLSLFRSVPLCCSARTFAIEYSLKRFALLTIANSEQNEHRDPYRPIFTIQNCECFIGRTPNPHSTHTHKRMATHSRKFHFIYPPHPVVRLSACCCCIIIRFCILPSGRMCVCAGVWVTGEDAYMQRYPKMLVCFFFTLPLWIARTRFASASHCDIRAPLARRSMLVPVK